MAKPLLAKIAGPAPSKSGHTQSQFTLTFVTPDGTVRYLTWGDSVSPEEFAESIMDASAEYRRGRGELPRPGAAEDRPAPTAGVAAEQETQEETRQRRAA